MSKNSNSPSDPEPKQNINLMHGRNVDTDGGTYIGGDVHDVQVGGDFVGRDKLMSPKPPRFILLFIILISIVAIILIFIWVAGYWG